MRGSVAVGRPRRFFMNFAAASTAWLSKIPGRAGLSTPSRTQLRIVRSERFAMSAASVAGAAPSQFVVAQIDGNATGFTRRQWRAMLHGADTGTDSSTEYRDRA